MLHKESCVGDPQQHLDEVAHRVLTGECADGIFGRDACTRATGKKRVLACQERDVTTRRVELALN